MLLYHGTSAIAAQRILKEGIRPRRDELKGIWPDNLKERAGCTYLSDCLAPLYALAAGNELKNEDWNKLALIEVDIEKLDQDKLWPDEHLDIWGDYDCAKRIVETRPEDLLSTIKDFWPLSLEKHGKVSYWGTISVEAIPRILLLDLSKNLRLSIIFDLIAWSRNTRVLSKNYDPQFNSNALALTKWWAGQTVKPEEILPDAVFRDSKIAGTWWLNTLMFAVLGSTPKERYREAEKILSNRPVEILTPDSCTVCSSS
ncbi:MAG: hypothetical protein ACE145_06015 [Terriglobia bacterium]